MNAKRILFVCIVGLSLLSIACDSDGDGVHDTANDAATCSVPNPPDVCLATGGCVTCTEHDQAPQE